MLPLLQNKTVILSFAAGFVAGVLTYKYVVVEKKIKTKELVDNVMNLAQQVEGNSQRGMRGQGNMGCNTNTASNIAQGVNLVSQGFRIARGLGTVGALGAIGVAGTMAAKKRMGGGQGGGLGGGMGGGTGCR